MANVFTHNLPLDKNDSFEVAHVGSRWVFGDELPHAKYWKPLSHTKAEDVVRCNNTRPGGVVFFNFGSNYAMSARKYIQWGEQGGIYRFKHRNNMYKDIVVRQAPLIVATVVVKGRTIQALSAVSGSILFEKKVNLNETIRFFEFRADFQKALVVANTATYTKMAKCMEPDGKVPLRGNKILVRAMIPTRRASPRRRTMRAPGQHVISHYFRAR